MTWTNIIAALSSAAITAGVFVASLVAIGVAPEPWTWIGWVACSLSGTVLLWTPATSLWKGALDALRQRRHERLLRSLDGAHLQIMRRFDSEGTDRIWPEEGGLAWRQLADIGVLDRGERAATWSGLGVPYTLARRTRLALLKKRI